MNRKGAKNGGKLDMERQKWFIPTFSFLLERLSSALIREGARPGDQPLCNPL